MNFCRHRDEPKVPDSGASTDEENDDGDFTVYECPGLAPVSRLCVFFFCCCWPLIYWHQKCHRHIGRRFIFLLLFFFRINLIFLWILHLEPHRCAAVVALPILASPSLFLTGTFMHAPVESKSTRNRQVCVHMESSHGRQQWDGTGRTRKPSDEGHDCKIRILYDNLNKKTKNVFIIINKHTHKTVVHVGPDCEVLSRYCIANRDLVLNALQNVGIYIWF